MIRIDVQVVRHIHIMAVRHRMVVQVHHHRHRQCIIVKRPHRQLNVMDHLKDDR